MYIQGDSCIMASLSPYLLALLAVSGVVISSQGQVESGYAGQLTNIDVNHHTVQELVKALPSMTNSLNGLDIVKVVQAQVQVVAGFKYVLTVQTRGKGMNGPATQECEISIWIQSWLEKRTLTSLKCKPINALGMVGGWSETNITDTVQKATNIGLELINSRCNCLFRKSITKVKKVQQKVVAGIMYKITIDIIQSVCRNTEENTGKGVEICPGSDGAVAKECEIIMIHQPWIEPKFRLWKHTCN